MVALQLRQYDFRSLDNRWWHTSQARHVDTKRVFRTARLQFAKEDHAALGFAHRHIPVAHTRINLFHLVEFVVVRGEKGAGVCLWVFVNMLHDGPGDGNAIVGGSAAAQFVEEHEAALREVVHDVGCLAHFHHKRTFAHRYIVRGAHSGEDFIDKADARAVGGHKTAHLGQQGDERRLAEQRTLTCHVGSRDDDNLLAIAVQLHIVGHIFLAHRHERFDDSVASAAYVEHQALVHHGPYILPFRCHLGQAVQAVQLRECCSVALERGNQCASRLHQFREDAVLQYLNFLLSPENFLLIFLEFLCDVAFGLGQRLFAHPFGGHVVAVGVAHLYVVAKHIVETDFQTGYARQFALALLEAEQVVLARGGEMAQFVQFFAHSIGDNAALA